jgi:hypothetical protein
MWCRLRRPASKDQRENPAVGIDNPQQVCGAVQALTQQFRHQDSHLVETTGVVQTSLVYTLWQFETDDVASRPIVFDSDRPDDRITLTDGETPSQ